MENKEYVTELDNEFNEEKVEYYQDWKNFGSEGSDDEWDSLIESGLRSL